MEDSNFNADYAYYCEADIDTSNIENIYQLNEKLKNKKHKQVKDYNFGDLVSFSEYRNTNTFIIGKRSGNLFGQTLTSSLVYPPWLIANSARFILTL